MRLRFGKRLLTGIAGLLILLFGVYLLIVATGLFTPRIDLVVEAAPLWQRVALIVGAVLLCALGVAEMGILFHRRRDKGFVMQHTELGDMSISMNALDTMVCKCVEQHKELCVKSTTIDRAKEGIDIEIRILLETGVNIPLTVNALQKQIKQYITSCSGVEVNTVKVLVETDAGKSGIPKLIAAHGAEPIRFAEAPVYGAKASEQNAAAEEAMEAPYAQSDDTVCAQADGDSGAETPQDTGTAMETAAQAEKMPEPETAAQAASVAWTDGEAQANETSEQGSDLVFDPSDDISQADGAQASQTGECKREEEQA